MAKIKQFGSGEVIFEESSTCDGVYIVTSGLVSIFMEMKGESVELARVGKGGMFGEMATIDLQERSAGARALEKATLVYLDHTEFLQRLQMLPLWALLLVQMLVQRLRTTNKMLLEARAELAMLHDDQHPPRVQTETPRPGVLVREEDIEAEKIIAQLDS